MEEFGNRKRYYGLKVALAICKRIRDNIWVLGGVW